MDYEHKDNPENQDWLDEILGAAGPELQLGPDEHAIHSAGLIHPDDMELEMILAEHRQAELEAEISASVESVMDEGVSPAASGERETIVGLDVEVQEAISNEVTQFIALMPDEPVLETEEEAAPAEQDDAVPMDETRFFADPSLTESEEDSQPTEEKADAEESVAEAPVSAEPDFMAEPDPEEEQPVEEEEPPVVKQRPKRKKGYGLLGIPHIIVTFIWLAIIVLIGVSLGRTLWLCCADVMAFGKADKEVVITINDNDTIDTISQKLADEGLIRYPWLFKQFAELTKKSENISKGTFTLNSRLDYNAMINNMSIYAAAREEVDIMFPEGYSCAQIFQLLEDNNVCTVAELEEYAANGELDDYWFLEGVERGDKYCLEGYLFPDTYTFYTNDDPERVLEKFLDCFDVRFTDIMKERLVTINEQYQERIAGFSDEYIRDFLGHDEITVREIVIIASLIEKESSGTDDESYLISAVIYNRLLDTEHPPYLNIDAAVIYGLGGKIDPVTGESIPLTMDDLATDTPYNTYLHTGLTPGPICNPGQECLNAALTPDEETNYYYYALDPETGTHRFFTKKEEDDYYDFLESVSYD